MDFQLGDLVRPNDHWLEKVGTTLAEKFAKSILEVTEINKYDDITVIVVISAFKNWQPGEIRWFSATHLTLVLR